MTTTTRTVCAGVITLSVVSPGRNARPATLSTHGAAEMRIGIRWAGWRAGTSGVLRGVRRSEFGAARPSLSESESVLIQRAGFRAGRRSMAILPREIYLLRLGRDRPLLRACARGMHIEVSVHRRRNRTDCVLDRIRGSGREAFNAASTAVSPSRVTFTYRVPIPAVAIPSPMPRNA